MPTQKRFRLIQKAKKLAVPLPADEITDIIYHSMPTTWRNKMIERGFNNADSTIKEMTDFVETRVENLEPKEDKKKSSSAFKRYSKRISFSFVTRINVVLVLVS